jgi:type III restriction enzyme
MRRKAGGCCFAMPQVVIENPILNSPYEEPARHFRFSDDGITDEIVVGRRPSSYFVPIPSSRKKGKGQQSFDTQWTQDRVEDNRFINRVRDRVTEWRRTGREGITRTSRQLLDHWTRPERDRRLFFCQVEALETAIYLNEVATRHGAPWIENELRQANSEMNPELFRTALKMATGSGKTLVMAMLIAWQALNKLRNPQDARFSDAFLVVTPGITVRDRLRVLLPSDPDNYYRKFDVVPALEMDELGRAKIVITNFHALQQRERDDASRLTKDILRRDRPDNPFRETPDQMVRRVCRELGNKRNIVVLNDEAHHCYRPREDEEKLTGEDRQEANTRNKEARAWLSGIEAVRRKIGVRAVYDLSATPFFLRGSGYKEGTLFPWVVSDFSLIDAIECGIVKIPRVPVADNAMTGEHPTFRELWPRIRDDLPRKGRGNADKMGDPEKLPAALQGALHSLYSNYEKSFAAWQAVADKADGATPPVFIVVCNNTSVSKLVYDYIAGYEKALPDDATVLVGGQLKLFDNVDDGRWRARPNTILVDSEQLESGEAMSADFKKIAAGEIEEFKAEYRIRFPGRDADALSDEDLLREVLNTVGKPGRLGEHVRCVVSVSMLTEGWDANTVTHILGVRAFGTQLLCEQVVGRGLRRMSWALEDRTLDVGGQTATFESLSPEYAEVYGVPFSFIPCSGATNGPVQPRKTVRVRALEEREACEITFPIIRGYRDEIPTERLSAQFSPAANVVLSTADLPTKTEVSAVVGQAQFHHLDDVRRQREQTVAFEIARTVIRTYLVDGDGHAKTWLFPQVLAITKEWMRRCLVLKDDTYPQLLLLHERRAEAAGRVWKAIVRSAPKDRVLLPVPRPFEPTGSTRHVDFDTVRPTWATAPNKCHVSHVVADTGSWEQKVAQALEEMPEVLAYVKNDPHQVGFKIPYVMNGTEEFYYPDFLVRWDDGGGEPLNVIVEVSGFPEKDKAEKVDTARTMFVPAMNNRHDRVSREWGRWAFVEVTDPWNAKTTLRAALGKGEARPASPEPLALIQQEQ